jgi:hypothetical protein
MLSLFELRMTVYVVEKDKLVSEQLFAGTTAMLRLQMDGSGCRPSLILYKNENSNVAQLAGPHIETPTLPVATKLF